MNKDYIFTFIFFVYLLTFTLFDVIEDISQGVPFNHWLHELIIAASSIVFILYKVVLAVKRDKTIHDYEEKIDKANLEVDFYKKKIHSFKDGINEILDQQFKIWGLTTSEQDIALLIIKGLSMKEIAETRHTSEATIRQQCSSIYKKSNLENRNQLSSYFLEDIFQ